MEITRNELDTTPGPGAWFTGGVFIDTVAVRAPGVKCTQAAAMREPPDGTAWHTHPHGQTIWVTEGVGLCQRRGDPIEVIRTGDRVFFEPGEDHWHGATQTRFMVHVAMQQADDDGSVVAWAEHVTDEEYGATTGSS